MHTVTKHTELRVYQAARSAAAKIFKLTLRFPPEERYGLTAQLRIVPGLWERISLKPGENAGTLQHFEVSSLTPKAKLRRRNGGWIAP